MTRNLGALCAVLGLVFGAGSAFAGDGGDMTRTCGVGPFTGAYVGAHIGYAQQSLDISDKLNGGGWGDDDGAFTGGVLSGYNIQCGKLLVGYEGDINFLDTSATVTVDTARLESSLDWYGTSRVRLGFIHNDNMLIYITGGLAYGDVQHTFSDSSLGFRKSTSDTQYGWTLGGGVELLHTGNWGLRVEGLYVDLGDETERYTNTTRTGTCTTTCEALVGWEDEFWVARVGLTYRFGSREEQAVPLK